ncbi:MAG: hypothetical protein HY960_13135 [Ignavibacteriae bacterium]|nr:hypothetical protein [Ignavibacteriota bacterium]
MDWQQLLSLLIVGVSAVLLVRHELRRRKRAKLSACGHDCGCSVTIKQKQTTFEV